MELYATGFNAWNQLRFLAEGEEGEPDDMHSFACVLRDEWVGRLRPCLSYTAGRYEPGRPPPPWMGSRDPVRIR